MPPEQQPRPEPITHPKLLVVEGPDDEWFLGALLRHLGIQNEFEIRKFEGVGNLGTFLHDLPGFSGFLQVESLGVIRDADKNAQSAFQSVSGHLQRANFSVPQRMKTVATGTPHIAVYIWPDCEHEGTLETLCLESVRRDPARDCVESYFACLEEQLDALPKAIHKAQLHAFLASRERPDLRLGEAARKGYWPWDRPVFNALKDFLRAL